MTNSRCVHFGLLQEGPPSAVVGIGLNWQVLAGAAAVLIGRIASLSVVERQLRPYL
jgi:hypothetical protein